MFLSIGSDLRWRAAGRNKGRRSSTGADPRLGDLLDIDWSPFLTQSEASSKSWVTASVRILGGLPI
jgi:hypothetical protein